MKKINIKTGLLGRGETFKILAVGHATGYPVLLVGPPGVGKTRVLLDYSMGLHNNNPVDALHSTFILETDEGTRPAEIKGRVDMEKLLAPGMDAAGKALIPKYELNSPISKAKMILINEVDKANPGLRNSMLGVMNEKMLFNGQDKIYCPWELFCASCNVIPKEEANNPFWDRFVIKHNVSRLTKTQMLQYYSKGTKAPVEINLPDQKDIEDFINNQLNPDILRAFLEVAYDTLSDRSLSYVPRVIAAISYVFEIAAKKSTIKACEVLIGPEKAKALAQKLEPAEISNIRNKIDYINSLQNYDQILNQIEDIKKAAQAASTLESVTKADMEDLAKELNKVLAKHPVYNAGNDNISKAMSDSGTKTNWNAQAVNP
jgi:MoxR-like ATPase